MLATGLNPIIYPSGLMQPRVASLYATDATPVPRRDFSSVRARQRTNANTARAEQAGAAGPSGAAARGPPLQYSWPTQSTIREQMAAYDKEVVPRIDLYGERFRTAVGLYGREVKNLTKEEAKIANTAKKQFSNWSALVWKRQRLMEDQSIGEEAATVAMEDELEEFKAARRKADADNKALAGKTYIAPKVVRGGSFTAWVDEVVKKSRTNYNLKK